MPARLSMLLRALSTTSDTATGSDLHWRIRFCWDKAYQSRPSEKLARISSSSESRGTGFRK